jgi:hypothetical protein
MVLSESQGSYVRLLDGRVVGASCAVVSNERISASSLMDSQVPWPLQSLGHAARAHAV